MYLRNDITIRSRDGHPVIGIVVCGIDGNRGAVCKGAGCTAAYVNCGGYSAFSVTIRLIAEKLIALHATRTGWHNGIVGAGARCGGAPVHYHKNGFAIGRYSHIPETIRTTKVAYGISARCRHNVGTVSIQLHAYYPSPLKA